MPETNEYGDVLADTSQAELLTMTGADILWLFASGYGEGSIAVYDPRSTEMRIVYEGENGDVYAQSVKERDDDGTAVPDVAAVQASDVTQYLVWIPTRRGLDFAREVLPTRATDPGAATLGLSG